MRTSFVSFVIASFVPAAALAQEPAPLPAPIAAPAPTAGWKDGFFVQSTDGAHKLKLGGYIHADSRWFIGDDDDKLVDQFVFRRIRLDLGGTLFERFEFRFLPDLAGGRLTVQDAWGDANLSKAFRVKVGKLKVPFGLERLQSATALLFVERGLPTQVAPNRDVGVLLWGEALGGVVSWALGVFNGVPDGGSSDGDVSDDKEFAARVFVSPWAGGKGPFAEVGAGGAVTYGEKLGTAAAPDVGSYRTAGQAAFFAPLVGTDAATTVIADGTHFRWTGQAYAYVGPVSVLGEVVGSSAEVRLLATTGTIDTLAWQAQVGVVLTGEKASFKGVKVDSPLDPGKGQVGAFELAGRVGGLTVDDAAFDDGFADPARSARSALALGGGVRWHANRAIRVVVDVERTQFDGGTANGEDRPAETVVLSRVQTVF